MAHRSSPKSSQDPPELRATRGELEQRWIELERSLKSTLQASREGGGLNVNAEYLSDAVWVGFQGAACERITRNRGGTTFVAPLCEISHGLVAWLGWQEVWDVTAETKPYRFRNAGLTVYLGKRFDARKPQLLRLEWPGIRNWSGGVVSFQSPGAGHPHWQLDLVQSMASESLSAVFEPGDGELIEDFESASREPTTEDLIARFSVERMHLASAAHWWLEPSQKGYGHHMNAPGDLKSLTRWLEQSLLYLRQELQRCVVHR